MVPQLPHARGAEKLCLRPCKHRHVRSRQLLPRVGGPALNSASFSRTSSPVFVPPPPVIISKVVVTLLMLISFCVIYILFCFDFDSLSAHIHYINAMKLNFTILHFCVLILATQTQSYII